MIVVELNYVLTGEGALKWICWMLMFQCKWLILPKKPGLVLEFLLVFQGILEGLVNMGVFWNASDVMSVEGMDHMPTADGICWDVVIPACDVDMPTADGICWDVVIPACDMDMPTADGICWDIVAPACDMPTADGICWNAVAPACDMPTAQWVMEWSHMRNVRSGWHFIRGNFRVLFLSLCLCAKGNILQG